MLRQNAEYERHRRCVSSARLCAPIIPLSIVLADMVSEIKALLLHWLD